MYTLEGLWEYPNSFVLSLEINLSPTPLPGAIAGIVLAILAFVVIAIAIALTVGVVVYKIKTGEWFKLKHKDDEKITVDFEKGLLMDEEQQKQNNMSSLKRVLSLGKANVSVCVTYVHICLREH